MKLGCKERASPQVTRYEILWSTLGSRSRYQIADWVKFPLRHERSQSDSADPTEESQDLL